MSSKLSMGKDVLTTDEQEVVLMTTNRQVVHRQVEPADDEETPVCAYRNPPWMQEGLQYSLGVYWSHSLTIMLTGIIESSQGIRMLLS